MFDLRDREIAALLKVLDAYIPRLRVEVHRTEFNRELRRQLEAEEALLSELRERLAAAREPLGAGI